MKNNIISISGVPVSGKSTTIKEIIAQLKQAGIDENNIHLISTGAKFRKYFNAVNDFIKNMGNDEVLQTISEDNELKDLFSNSKFRNALINAIVQLRKSNYDIKDFSVEQANNLEELKDIRAIIDTSIDTRIQEIGKEINQEEDPNDFWIVDSRLAFNNIPESFSVRLTIDEDIAAKRLLADKSRGKEDSNYKDLEEAKRAIVKRKNGEVKRYIQRYNVDLEDENNYDLIIDTSYSNVSDIAETILKCQQQYMKDKPFAKKWTSPKKLLPMQREIDTLDRGAVYSMEEMVNRIKNKGYAPYEEIEVIEANNKLAIHEGHHRNFAMAMLGKTLVPYNVIAKNEQNIPGQKNTANTMIQGVQRGNLLGHENFFDKNFSYDKIYPGIYEELENNYHGGDER